MTKKTAAKTVAHYVAEIDKRIATEKSAATFTKNKENKTNKFRSALAHAQVIEMLNAVNYDATFINQRKIENKLTDIYVVEKIANYLLVSVDKLHVKESCVAMLRTVINCEIADMTVTCDDFKVACSKDLKASDDRKSVIVQNNATQSMSTVAVQYRSSYRALEALNVLKRVKVENKIRHFEVQRDNVIYKAIKALFVERYAIAA